MIDTTQAFFARLAQRGNDPLLHSVSGTIRWDIEDAGSWFVAVNNGSLTRHQAKRPRRKSRGDELRTWRSTSKVQREEEPGEVE